LIFPATIQEERKNIPGKENSMIKLMGNETEEHPLKES
jgi:hypothetical protein